MESFIESLSANAVFFLIYLLFLCGFGIISVILQYHWVKYEVNSAHTKRFVTLYYVVSVVLLLLSGMVLLFYTL